MFLSCCLYRKCLTGIQIVVLLALHLCLLICSSQSRWLWMPACTGHGCVVLSLVSPWEAVALVCTADGEQQEWKWLLGPVGLHLTAWSMAGECHGWVWGAQLSLRFMLWYLGGLDNFRVLETGSKTYSLDAQWGVGARSRWARCPELSVHRLEETGWWQGERAMLSTWCATFTTLIWRQHCCCFSSPREPLLCRVSVLFSRRTPHHAICLSDEAACHQPCEGGVWLLGHWAPCQLEGLRGTRHGAISRHRQNR